MRDSSHCIEILQKIQSLPPGSLISSLDVVCLYPSMDQNECIAIMRKVLIENRSPLEKPSVESLIELLGFVLKFNNFQFDGKDYLQVGGTVMGTKVAPSLASIYMEDFEERFIYTHDPAPDFFIRFLDDCPIGWSHGREKFDEFVTYLNSCHKSIKFTAEVSDTCVPFLDLNVHIEEGKIWTDLYCKPTDSHNYLHFTLAHPEHNKTSLSYSQYLRLKRICSRGEDFKKHCQMITFHFVRRGYPKNLLQQAFDKVNGLKRDDVLNKETIEYNPGFEGMKTIVKENWGILSRSSTTKKLSELCVIHGFRRPKNLRNELVWAKIPAIEKNTKQPGELNCETRNKCKTKNCKYCAILNYSGRITSTYTGHSYITWKNVTCESPNIIYCITCKTCKKHYVGQTKLRCMDRIQAHFNKIQSKDPKQQTDISHHFKQADHNGRDGVQVQI